MAENYGAICAVSLTVPQNEIYYISWNLDACEGLGFLQTDDAAAGRVTVFTPAPLICDLYGFIDGLRAEGIPIEINGAADI